MELELQYLNYETSKLNAFATSHLRNGQSNCGHHIWNSRLDRKYLSREITWNNKKYIINVDKKEKYGTTVDFETNHKTELK